ncbi:MAG: hypothetical protein WD845_04160, partial [Pirellulales bacterium]
MGKEAKIGIVVVGVLAGALIGLAVKRFVLTAAPVGAPDASSVAGQPEPVAKNTTPTVVAAQQSDAALGDIDSRMWANNGPDSSGGVPHGSFLPADEAEPNARYARQAEPQPFEPAVPKPAPSNPFAGPVGGEP